MATSSSSKSAKKEEKKRKAKSLDASGDSRKSHNKNDNSSNKKSKVAGNKSKTSPQKQPRKHADVVAESKAIWNQLRQKNLSKEQRRDLLDKLLPLIQGKCRDLCLKHDAARVVQAALQFGTKEERRTIVSELTKSSSGTLAELSQNSYAHFCVLKIVQYCHADDVCLTQVLNNLKGHTAKLAVHAVGCRVIESLYTTIPSKRFQPLMLELFGPHVQLFATATKAKTKDNDEAKTNDPRTLLESCLNQAPEHNESIRNFVQQLVYKGLEKDFYALTFFQDLLNQYCTILSGQDVRALLQAHPTACDHVVRLISSKEGVRVVCRWASYGTAKDRKRMLQSFKGYARSGLLHPHAYLALLRLTQLTDDTVALNKYLFHELLTVPDKDKDAANKNDDSNIEEQEHPLLELALSESAHKLFLFVLLLPNIDALRKAMDPYEANILEPGVVPTLTAPSNNDENASASQTIPTSKKETAQRHAELLNYFRKPLLDLCTQHADHLLVSRCGSVVLRCVYQTLGQQSEDISGMVRAVVRECKSGEEDGDDSNAGDNGRNDAVVILDHRIGHLAVKNLILSDAASEEKGKGSKPSISFARAFLDAFDKASLTRLALTGNRGAFVVSALFQVPSIRSKIQIDTNALKRHMKTKGQSTGARGDDEAETKKRKKGENEPQTTSTAGLQALFKAIQS